MEISVVSNVLAPVIGIQVLTWTIPGPSHLAVAFASVCGGRRAGIIAALGVATGAVTLALIGIGGMLLANEWMPMVQKTVRILGIAYLMLFGFGLIQHSKRDWIFHTPKLERTMSCRVAFCSAYLAMICNPKAIIIYGSVLTLFLPAQGEPAIISLMLIQIGIVGWALFGLAACIFSTPKFVRTVQEAGPILSVTVGTLIFFAGAALAYETFAG